MDPASKKPAGDLRLGPAKATPRSIGRKTHRRRPISWRLRRLPYEFGVELPAAQREPEGASGTGSLPTTMRSSRVDSCRRGCSGGGGGSSSGCGDRGERGGGLGRVDSGYGEGKRRRGEARRGFIGAKEARTGPGRRQWRGLPLRPGLGSASGTRRGRPEADEWASRAEEAEARGQGWKAREPWEAASTVARGERETRRSGRLEEGGGTDGVAPPVSGSGAWVHLAEKQRGRRGGLGWLGWAWRAGWPRRERGGLRGETDQGWAVLGWKERREEEGGF